MKNTTMNQDNRLIFFDRAAYENGLKSPVSNPSQHQHDEEDMSNPKEVREVQIGNEIQSLVNSIIGTGQNTPGYDDLKKIHILAHELIEMHSKSSTGSAESTPSLETGDELT